MPELKNDSIVSSMQGGERRSLGSQASLDSGKWKKRKVSNHKRSQHNSLDRSHSLEAIELDARKANNRKEKKGGKMMSYSGKFR